MDCAKRATDCECNGERGVALIEFTLLISFLALMMFAVHEYGRILRQKQALSQLSREVANVVHRNCSPRPVNNRQRSIDALEACINDAFEEVNLAAQQFSRALDFNTPDIHVALWDGGGGQTPRRLGLVTNGAFLNNNQSSSAAAFKASSFAANDFGVGRRLGETLNQQGRVAIGELYVNYQPSVFTTFGGLSFANILLEDVTVF